MKDPSPRQLKSTSGDKIKSILKDMTLAEKIGQMSQIDISLILKENSKELDTEKAEHYIGELAVGSVLNSVYLAPHAEDYRSIARQLQNISVTYNRVPLIWGLDSVHGANYIQGASIPPQAINMAATFNRTVAFEAGRVASRDTRAAGISWLFSPLLGIALEPKWSRVYETFGEDPHLVSIMAEAMIDGIQEVDPNPDSTPSKAAACAKHFVGYSKPLNGHDRSPSWIPTRHLYQYFVPPWKKVAGKVLTVMESYTETDGVPNVANHQSTQYLLRQRLGFQGVLVTDYEEIFNLNGWHHTAGDNVEATIQSLTRGSVDMSMIPFDTDGFAQGINTGLESHRLLESRLDASVERILRLKLEHLGMSDDGVKEDDPNLKLVGSDHDAVLQMATESMVLSKNEAGTLPLAMDTKVLITGPTSSSVAYLAGGWTGGWQGSQSEEWFGGQGNTILDAFEESPGLQTQYSCGVNILGGECNDEESKQGILDHIEDWVGLGPSNSIERAVEAAKNVDAVVVCVGEEAYAEKPGDIRSMDLPLGQYELIRQIKSKTNAKVILVYVGGRPRLLKDMAQQADAVVLAFLPGPWGGPALANLVRGESNFSGKLPISYPKFPDGGGIPYFRAVSDKCTIGTGPLPYYDYEECSVEWPFGHGLSYTSFSYSDLQVLGEHEETVSVSVKVTNTGQFSGADVVMVFTFDQHRSVTPEYKRLRGFHKVSLGPSQSEVVKIGIPREDMKFIGPDDDSHFIFDPSLRYFIGVGDSTDCRANPDSDLCVPISPASPEPLIGYENACDEACTLWHSSGCAGQFGLSPKSCRDMCGSISIFPNTLETTCPGNGWGWNYVRCLESVVWGLQQSPTEDCWKMTAICRDIFTTSGLDAYGMGPQTSHNPIATGGVVNFVALLAAILSAFVMSKAVRGRLPRFDRDAIEFTRVSTEAEQ